MTSPEALEAPEAKKYDHDEVRRRIGEYGLNMPVYDASEDEYPNPRDDNQRWAVAFDPESHIVRGEK